MADVKPIVRTAVVLLFFLSGFASLVYEVVWVRLLSPFVGGGTISISTVLAVFMLGLALGSALASRRLSGRWTDARLLRTYAILELLIAVCGLLIPFVFRGLTPIYRAVYRASADAPMAYNVVSSMIAGLVLLTPTCLMGATLPVLCSFYVRSNLSVSRQTGLLYGANTLGAAVGALLCGYWLLARFGMWGSIGLAAVTNVAVALASVGLAATLSPGRGNAETPIPANVAEGGSAGLLPDITIVLGVSGLCSMAYEVVWTRLLSLLIGPTTFSFTLVLFSFIGGLGLGSLVFGWLGDRVKNPRSLLWLTQILAAASALALSQVLGHSQWIFAKLLHLVRDSFVLAEGMKFVTVALLLLIPTVLLGASIPLAVCVHAQSARDVGRRIGMLYAANTVGAIAGSLGAGFLLIPGLGQARAISVLCAVQAMAVVLLALRGLPRSPRRCLAFTVAGVAIVVTCTRLPAWNTWALARARYQRSDEVAEMLTATPLFRLWQTDRIPHQSQPSERDVVYLADGVGGFVAVIDSVNSLGVTNRYLSVSGKVDASSRHDMHTQVLSGQAPMLWHPDAKNVMVLGLASGITAGEILNYPVASLDILEICPEVVEACGFFADWNNGVLTDPRAKVIVQDAKTHLLLTDRRYDVITSEPSNPWMAGIASLFTRDFFQTASDRLTENGIFVQWAHTYQMDWQSFAIIGRTLSSVFPNSLLMKTSTRGSDYLLVGFKNPEAKPDLGTARRNLEHATATRNARLCDPAVLYPLIVAENLAEVFGPGLVHSDNHPHLEFSAPRRTYGEGEDFAQRILSRRSLDEATERVARTFANVENQLLLADFMASVNIPPFGPPGLPQATEKERSRYREIVTDFCSRNMVRAYSELVLNIERAACLDIHEKKIVERLGQPSFGPHDDLRRAVSVFDLGNIYVAREDMTNAASSYATAAALRPGYARALMNMGLCYEQLRQPADALAAFRTLCRVRPRSPEALTHVGANYLLLGIEGTALRYFEKALSCDPGYAPALLAAGAVYGQRSELERAAACFRRAIAANPASPTAYRNLALAILRLGRPGEAVEWVNRGLQAAPSDQGLLRLRAALLLRTTN